MESTRQKKIGRLLQKELGEIFQREGSVMFSGVLITVTHVRVTPDLSSAKVYLSLFLHKDKESFLKTIREKTTLVRMKLAEKIKKQVRVIPKLDFFLDDSLDYAEKIDELLKK